jgi:hypothetical protein
MKGSGTALAGGGVQTCRVEFIHNNETFYTVEGIPVEGDIHSYLLNKPKIIDVSGMLYTPEALDFWDTSTSMYIPNYIARGRKVPLKNHAEVLDWVYFVCVDAEGNIPLVIKQKLTPENEKVIAGLRSNPEIKVG